jgi:hypothetical protein
MWISSDHTGGPPTAQAKRPITTWPLAALSTTSATAPSGPLRRSSSRKTTRRTASTTSTVTAARAMSSALRRAGEPDGAHRTHLLHAGQHDPHDRAIPRSAAHEPVRPRGLADEDGSSSTTPPADNFLPWTHVPNQIPLNRALPRLRLSPSPRSAVGCGQASDRLAKESLRLRL